MILVSRGPAITKEGEGEPERERGERCTEEGGAQRREGMRGVGTKHGVWRGD